MTRESSSPESESHVQRGLAVLAAVLVVGSALAAGVGSVGAASAANSSEEAVFEIERVETNAPITAGEVFETTIEVTNTGNQTATKRVWFELGPHLKNETQVELAPGETAVVDLRWDSWRGTGDTWELTAATPDDTVTRMVTIEKATSGDSSGSDDSTDSSGSNSSESNSPATGNSTVTDDPSDSAGTDATTDPAGSAQSAASDGAPAPDGPSLYTTGDSVPATVTVEGTTVSTMPSKGVLFDAMEARDGDAVGYNYTRATTERGGNESAVVLVDVDGDGTAEIAFLDRDGDGTADPTRRQFHVLYPEVNWGAWDQLVT